MECVGVESAIRECRLLNEAKVSDELEVRVGRLGKFQKRGIL